MSESDSPQIPDTWAFPTVGEVGAVRVGRQRSPERLTGRYSTPYLRAANITAEGLALTDVLEMDFTPAEREVFALRDGDVLLAEASGSAMQVGRPAIWRDELPECCIQNTIIRFRAHTALPEYALVVFRHFVASGVFARTARGVGILHLGGRRLAELPFPLPPLAEQERIVEEVQRRDSELRRTRLALAEALARTNEQDLAILAAATTGEIPARRKAPPRTGWTQVPIDTAGSVTLGKARSNAAREDSEWKPYLRVANVLEDDLDLSDLNEMPFTPSETKKYELQPGDILLNEGQSPELVGRPAMYRGERPELYFQNALLRFRAGPTVESDFALLVFRHYLHSGEFRRVARRSTNIAHLSRSRFAALPFPVPPLTEQRAIVRDARARLATSAAQRSNITDALERIPVLAAELFAAAASGVLVEQRSGDGTATDLLAQAGPPPPDPDPRKQLREDEEPPVSHSMPSSKPSSSPLADILNDRGSLPIPDLFKATRLDVNDTGDIEICYIMLRAELGKTVRVVGDLAENQLLEVIRNAT